MTSAPRPIPQADVQTLASSQAQPTHPPQKTSQPATPSSTSQQQQPGLSLLDSVLDNTSADRAQSLARLSDFLSAKTVRSAAQAWYGDDLATMDRNALLGSLARDIAVIDRLLNDQVNAILHDPRFQKLEASWRGLEFLIRQSDPDTKTFVRVLNVSWKELSRDFESAGEFDRSQLFRKVYEEEFGTAGGRPYGLLIGDYSIHPRVTADNPVDDMATLQAISGVAASAFAPFVAAADHTFFGEKSFANLERQPDLHKLFESPEYAAWKNFRDTDDARFVGLTLPRILMRLPYADDGSRVDRFRFSEDVSAADRSGYVWGNPAFAFGAVVMRAYAQSGWFADIRGVRRGELGGGIIEGLPTQSFATDARGVATKTSTDVIVTDLQEKELGDLGFIALCDCYDTPHSAFYGTPTAHKPRSYSTEDATANARISAMLQYILCASRFAHHLKVIARSKIGSNIGAQELEDLLINWLNRYVSPDSEGSMELKARLPLREARVEVKAQRGRPGVYTSIIHLRPHYQLDAAAATVRLSAEMSGLSTTGART
jgi:type VI secretion system ImpC/EvpB family protein